jgi:Rrf2 family protein
MQLTMTGEYAIRTMVHLSSLPFGTIAQISDIAKQWDIPDNFLRKISAQLASADLIVSVRGINGGIGLSRPAETLTLLDVIEAVEGKIALNKCLLCDRFCPREEWCEVHEVWTEAQRKLKEVLSSKSLAQLAAESLSRRAALQNARQQITAA